MKTEIGYCAKCNEYRPLVNKRYGLCNTCNYIRLNGRRPQYKPLVQKTPLKASKPLKSKRRINRTSRKQRSVNQELSEVYRKMSEEQEHLCTGCGTAEKLTHSHLIPRSWSANLTTDPKNITYHCLNCHEKWEGVEKWQLKDFKTNMEFVKNTDKVYYNILLQKLPKHALRLLQEDN